MVGINMTVAVKNSLRTLAYYKRCQILYEIRMHMNECIITSIKRFQSSLQKHSLKVEKNEIGVIRHKREVFNHSLYQITD